MTQPRDIGLATRTRRPFGQSSVDKDSPFYVPRMLDLMGRIVSSYPGIWLRLGDFESMLLAPRTCSYAITKPLYVCGLARSGSTLLHEILSSHPKVATHRLKD